MYLLLLLAQNLPTELQGCPHPQTHQVGVFCGQSPGGLAVSQVKILLKHVHIRTAFMSQYQEEGKILIKLAKSEENAADINTNNTVNVIFQKNQKKIECDKDETTDKKISENHLSSNRKNVKNILCKTQLVRQIMRNAYYLNTSTRDISVQIKFNSQKYLKIM